MEGRQMQQWYRYSDQNYRGEYSGNLSHLLLWPTPQISGGEAVR
jgi:hypothetical protein